MAKKTDEDDKIKTADEEANNDHFAGDDLDDLVPDDEYGYDDVRVKSDKDKIKKLKEEIKELRKKNKEYLDGWQRSRAELVNAGKSLEERAEKRINDAEEKILLEILTVVDSFDMAMSDKKIWESIDKNWRVGMEYVFKQLHDILRKYSLSEINPKELDEFNPEKHSPLATRPAQEKKHIGKIYKTMKKGYERNGKVIRPAMVEVYVAEENKNPGKSDGGG